MEIQNLIDKETLSQLPLIFQTLKAMPIEDVEKARKANISKFITIDFYQTTDFMPYAHYKPISKILKTDDNKPK
jgi:hypothetical protein